jgi:hypothetical protein
VDFTTLHWLGLYGHANLTQLAFQKFNLGGLEVHAGAKRGEQIVLPVENSRNVGRLGSDSRLQESRLRVLGVDVGVHFSPFREDDSIRPVRVVPGFAAPCHAALQKLRQAEGNLLQALLAPIPVGAWVRLKNEASLFTDGCSAWMIPDGYSERVRGMLYDIPKDHLSRMIRRYLVEPLTLHRRSCLADKPLRRRYALPDWADSAFKSSGGNFCFCHRGGSGIVNQLLPVGPVLILLSKS